VKPLYGSDWRDSGDGTLTDELGHRRHAQNVPCFLGGRQHSYRLLGTDVRHCVTMEISACVYDGRERARKPRAVSAG
jgi:hypothetical protein